MEKIETAKLNYLKMAPRKVRLVVSSLKGLPVSEAEAQLLISPKRANIPILKLIHSAVANAKNNRQMNVNKLVIKEIRVDDGPMTKRYMPRATGRATPIHKKSSHITLVLAEMPELKESRFKFTKPQRVSSKKRKEMKAAKEPEKPKMPENEKPGAERRGFMKRLFRRKSI